MNGIAMLEEINIYMDRIICNRIILRVLGVVIYIILTIRLTLILILIIIR